MAKQPQPGDVVEVRFLDHCENGDGQPLEFVVYGRSLVVLAPARAVD